MVEMLCLLDVSSVSPSPGNYMAGTTLLAALRLIAQKEMSARGTVSDVYLHPTALVRALTMPLPCSTWTIHNHETVLRRLACEHGTIRPGHGSPAGPTVPSYILVPSRNNPNHPSRPPPLRPSRPSFALAPTPQGTSPSHFPPRQRHPPVRLTPPTEAHLVDSHIRRTWTSCSTSRTDLYDHYAWELKKVRPPSCTACLPPRRGGRNVVSLMMPAVTTRPRTRYSSPRPLTTIIDFRSVTLVPRPGLELD
ncbi:hypothetical protein D9619_011374 [Psilocybe cf. subviscida]|uniref:Uncharacterized protein n=1 Tax=Psilocybe cf. subviscida TaxID=2480587 RepID=A0A8H5F5H3_9AGAR|nr:hypothetical protein D9619_011374 [Psilocybe cf. subviscida]